MSKLPLIGIRSKSSVILYFSIINVKLRYKGTNLGFLWNALEPLLTFLVLYAVFTSIKIGRNEDFAIYLLSGIIFYHIFTRGTLAGLGSLRNNKGIIISLNVGNEFFLAVAVGSICLTSIVEIAVLLILFPFFQFAPSISLALLPVVLALILILILGLTYILSVLNVFFKDIVPIWGVFIHALFFISPIFWYLSDVEGILLSIQAINPVGQIIELSHSIIVYGEAPPLSDWLYTSAFVFGILFFGFYFFKKFENKIVEEL